MQLKKERNNLRNELCHVKKLGLDADSIRSLASKFHFLCHYAQTNRSLCKSVGNNKAECMIGRNVQSIPIGLQQKFWIEIITSRVMSHSLMLPLLRATSTKFIVQSPEYSRNHSGCRMLYHHGYPSMTACLCKVSLTSLSRDEVLIISQSS